MGALRLAAKYEMSSFISDTGMIPVETQKEIETLGFEWEENGHSLNLLSQYDFIVKSPGIPDTASIIVDLVAANKHIVSEIEFAYYFNTAKLIGITGSNGKTTTTLLITHLLCSAGIDAVSAGNVGNSFSALIAERTPEVIVLELSSFQLDGIVDFRPDIGILLNITPDHLDRYSYDINLYAASKFRLTENMESTDTFIYNMDDAVMVDIIADRSLPETSQGFSLQSVKSSFASLSSDSLVFAVGGGSPEEYPVDTLALLGRHNYYNQMAAVLAVQEMGLNHAQIASGLETFVNAPHRLETVATIDGVRYINDSKATNVDAVYYALDAMTQPIVWIAGGINKGNDYDQIKELVQTKVKALICLGKDNQHLINAFGQDIDTIIEVSTAEMAVEQGRSLAEDGDVVLLSPACSSFDLFDNFGQRGDFFRDEVLRLTQKEKTAKA